MVKLNSNLVKLPGNYLFSEVGHRVEKYKSAHPEKRIISLGIGDVTRPLPPSVAEAMAQAAREMGTADGFHGYSPDQGYLFLRQAITQTYKERGVEVHPEEVFISDGAKTDCGALGELFGRENLVAICDPAYSVYIDTSVMAGRAGEYDEKKGIWSTLVYLPCRSETDFLPQIPTQKADLIYLCSPCNPTGVAFDRENLTKWVDYARKNGSIILFDGAYEAFITSPDVPHSIYEIPGARDCAIELRSFSKTAGFTGVRCGYTIIPKELKREGLSLIDLWRRRQATKSNGVSYITQRGAQAVCSQQGQEELAKNIVYYQRNADVLWDGLTTLGLKAHGGVDAPYLWVETPNKVPSWDFFTLLLEQVGLVITPGAGFGSSGEGYIRLTAFGSHENTLEALDRLKEVLS